MIGFGSAGSPLKRARVWTARTSNMSDWLCAVHYGGGYWVACDCIDDEIATATDAEGTWTQIAAPVEGIRASGYFNSLHIVGGENGALYTASDPTGSWTSRTSNFGGGSDSITAFATDFETAVILGDLGNICTSTDGTTWTARTDLSGAENQKDAIYADGYWVSVGNSGSLYTATDATSTWTSRTSSFGSSQLRNITYGNGTWLAVGVDNKIATASDPTSTWTQKTSPFSSGYPDSAAYGNGVFVIGSTVGEIAISTDPTDNDKWNLVTSGFSGTAIANTRYIPGLFVSTGNSGKISTSPSCGRENWIDLDWTARTSSFSTDDVRNVAYDGSTNYLLVGGAGKIATATDPTGTWTQRTSNIGNDIIFDAAYDGTTWAICASNTVTTNTLATATDPTGTWTVRNDPLTSGGSVYFIDYADSIWLCGGANGELSTASDATSTWTARTANFSTDSIIDSVYSSDDDLWVIIGTNGKMSTASDATSTWTSRTSSFGSTNINGVAYGNGWYVAVGESGKIATATDATGTWTQRINPFTNSIRNVFFYNDLFMAVGYDSSNNAEVGIAVDPTKIWTLVDTGFSTSRGWSTKGFNGLWIACGRDGKLATAPVNV